MTNEEILELLKVYETELLRQGHFSQKQDPRLRGNNFRFAVGPGDALNHCLWMVKKTQVLVTEGHREEAFRWLGFIQGVLWETGVYTIDAGLCTDSDVRLAVEELRNIELQRQV